MQSHNLIGQLWSQFCRCSFVGKVVCGAAFGLLLLIVTLYTNVSHAHAAAATMCSSDEQSYTVASSDTLGRIASRYGTSWSSLASRNSIANPNLIFAGQGMCIPEKATVSQAPVALVSQASAAPVTLLAPAQADSGSVVGMINHVFGRYAGSAMRIASCESGLNPNATNPVSIGGSHAVGVFQILYPSTWNSTSQANASPYNAHANIMAAHEIFVRDGYSWREWSCR